MKLFVSLALLSVVSCALSLVPPRGEVAPPPPPPPPTLSQDLEEVFALIPLRPIHSLVNRYLLNDRQFQTVIRMYNSHDAYIARMRLRSEPEMIQFNLWLLDQLQQSGGLQFEFEELTEIFLVNKSPYWPSTVFGLQGFFNEFFAYVPQDVLRNTITTKLAQRGSFSLLWQRLQLLRPVYERFLEYPETQRIVEALRADGINTAQLDQAIRIKLGWVDVPTTTAETITTVTPNANGQAVEPAAEVVA